MKITATSCRRRSQAKPCERDQAGTQAHDSAALCLGPVPSAHGALRRRPARDDVAGGGALTVSTHLALDARNCWVQEMVRAFYFGWYDRFVTNRPPLLQGEITVPDGPD